MKLNFSLENILSSTKDFLIDNQIISGLEDVKQPPGKEHYFFLASLGVQLQNKKIIELGTHKGVSSIALNYGNKKYNNNNTIITYDIMNILFPNIFDNTSIDFRIENLFDPQIREQNIENILSSDIIFIDIDPHEGVLEFEMYNWLKENNYKGLIFFDDIHLGVGHMGVFTGNSMQQFWDKVDNKDKLDLTKVGHWSGTGLVCFDFNNHEIIV
jgi:predicted O-methyltransferase YrrM